MSKHTLRYFNQNILTRIISAIYGSIMEIRNYFFRKKIISSTSFSIPIISVGNLAVGGTGKTPHIEYLIRLLQKDFKLAVLSRGYGRKTSGFLKADKNSSANNIGDEPFQIYSKFPEISVYVDEKRVHGVTEIIQLQPEIEIILLDDAYQHQYIKSGMSILLTDYELPFTRDFVMPYGRLREQRKNYNRADIILVTKCPIDIKDVDIQKYTEEILLLKKQEIFFSAIEYDNFYPAYENCEIEIDKLKNTDAIILTGIENPQTMIKYIEKLVKSVEKITFADHHLFSKKELDEIEIKSKEKIIITTEKDLARIKSHKDLSINLKEKLLVLPIKIKILKNKEDVFNQKLKNYVSENSRNSRLH